MDPQTGLRELQRGDREFWDLLNVKDFGLEQEGCQSEKRSACRSILGEIEIRPVGT